MHMLDQWPAKFILADVMHGVVNGVLYVLHLHQPVPKLARSSYTQFDL